MAHRPRRPRLRALAAAAVVGTILTGAAAPSAAAADPDAGWTVTPLPVAAAALSRIATGGGATFTVGFGFAGSGRDQLFVPFAAQRVGDRWVSEPAPTPDGNLQARLDDVTVLGPKDAWAVGTGVDNDAKALPARRCGWSASTAMPRTAPGRSAMTSPPTGPAPRRRCTGTAPPGSRPGYPPKPRPSWRTSPSTPAAHWRPGTG